MSEATDSTYRLPEELLEVKAALPGALYYLQLGKRPSTLPSGSIKGTRINLSNNAEAYLLKLTPEFGSRTKVIVHALAWFKEQDQRTQLLVGSIKL